MQFWMNFNSLQLAAADVIAAIDANPPQQTSVDVLASIKNQMVFIRDKAAVGQNPSAELPVGATFTYAVLASRELASPDELALQAIIDKVSTFLIER